jgi:hypothetical protein
MPRGGMQMVIRASRTISHIWSFFSWILLLIGDIRTFFECDTRVSWWSEWSVWKVYSTIIVGFGWQVTTCPRPNVNGVVQRCRGRKCKASTQYDCGANHSYLYILKESTSDKTCTDSIHIANSNPNPNPNPGRSYYPTSLRDSQFIMQIIEVVLPSTLKSDC